MTGRLVRLGELPLSLQKIWGVLRLSSPGSSEADSEAERPSCPAFTASVAFRK